MARVIGPTVKIRICAAIVSTYSKLLLSSASLARRKVQTLLWSGCRPALSRRKATFS